ncbi:hypothetical protein [Saccharothrix sp. HUAS TT1]|uniref:hypothetical protein n=1 Tax=unclassified Saccharothrix TaxID=2593673 RepID=UPI00345BC319
MNSTSTTTTGFATIPPDGPLDVEVVAEERHPEPVHDGPVLVAELVDDDTPGHDGQDEPGDVDDHPRLGWHAGRRSGAIRTSEGLVTITLDGRSLLGIDLPAGVIGMWPDDDDEEWVRVGKFDTTPLPPSPNRRPAAAGYELLVGVAEELGAALDTWQRIHEGDSVDDDDLREARETISTATQSSLETLTRLLADGEELSINATGPEIDALQQLAPPSCAALYESDAVGRVLPEGREHGTLRFHGGREVAVHVVRTAGRRSRGEQREALRALLARIRA